MGFKNIFSINLTGVRVHLNVHLHFPVTEHLTVPEDRYAHD